MTRPVKWLSGKDGRHSVLTRTQSSENADRRLALVGAKMAQLSGKQLGGFLPR